MNIAALSTRKQRIIAIAEELVSGMVAKGAVDPGDESAMDAACSQAVADAAALYDAAIEYIS
ncbi:hypothetical protein [Pseudomonas mosselii]|uniref:hypothetical protein n=1 Tax=Pseudomonas mosselii TaxID=78327 RepID=UPI0021D982DD|nr:hypothetical protein [Pseudomonas mosselii]MCU9527535.1 hypothetical protein [Pseudomonas mosselii]MCU9534848.1 hypothetical protein [Pseudomonas mosselii]MCU9542782.1 hypothetical protein [Pseudomonas mosselii]MCU9546688.1 hypothetical protein [Pseudomonas mosselii]